MLSTAKLTMSPDKGIFAFGLWINSLITKRTPLLLTNKVKNNNKKLITLVITTLILVQDDRTYHLRHRLDTHLLEGIAKNFYQTQLCKVLFLS